VIAIEGLYYDGKTSRARPARLEVYRDGTTRLRGEGLDTPGRFAALRIGDRVGTTPWLLEFADGGKLETTDNDGVDAALAAFGLQRRSRLLHLMESRWRYVAVACVVVVAASLAFVRWGVPAAARTAAFALPQETSQLIGQGALEILDKAVFVPTRLTAKERVRVQALFDDVARERPDLGMQLALRGGGRVGPNAFALPSGTIVLTDELVRLARADAELLAVIAHEAGHLAERHALRRLIQGSGLALLVVLVTGDISSTTALVGALPTLLVEAQYSRAFEREADDYAAAWLLAHGHGTRHLADLLERMEAQRPAGVQVPDWLASHPATSERRERLRGRQP
jgi:Zn-dependent protease with chaperone function